MCFPRYLEEYLDSKRPLSPVSPLSDSPESTKPPSKTKTMEQHHIHKNRDKNRDSAIKVRQKKKKILFFSDHPTARSIFGLFIFDLI